ncbi:predicted protein [Fibroporia radiculosa]|uniref:Uncharacterized protein n=1 Tax=Fibroporia radiculosa TaxID=599839 RepID=J4GVB8_9APHY|nr:predicted protein [Fibroporia radiculosa]
MADGGPPPEPNLEVVEFRRLQTLAHVV